MATALFISHEDIKRYSAISGNVDNDKIKQWIAIAQDIHIENYLGSDLFNKISTDILNNSLSGDYLDLVNNHVKKMTIHFTIVELLPQLSITIANKGVYKHTSENAELATKEEIDDLIEKHRKIAAKYVDRFLKYMCVNYTLFTEYTSNETGDTFPSKDNSFNGWYF
jgi:hypothetical protein